MGYYLVWVRSVRYRGREPLTYSSVEPLVTGQIVRVGLQREQVLGFVERAVSKPHFATKPVIEAFDLPPLPVQTIELCRWLMAFYATSLGTAVSQVLPPALTARTIGKLERLNINTNSTTLPPLNEAQLNVVKKITKSDTYLLHGRTGSGKTRIYVELAQQAISNGTSVIVLTPEISLTSQLAQSFRTLFDKRVLVLHSQLTPAERRSAWLHILKAQSAPLVIIGPRSALFTPVTNVGLLVIDEAHEPAYKQEQAPYYHARSVASKLAELHQAPLIIGSATPSISDYYLAEQRQKPILRITQQAAAQPEASSWAKDVKVHIIDLKDRTQFTRSPRLSQPMLAAIQASLSRGEQSLIYLNRRGTARIVLCENCGWQALCPHCDLPLVYHADSGNFRCHTCGFNQSIVTSCPDCHNPSVVFKSFGTKAIAAEVAKLFPQAHVQRFDTDNSKAESFQAHYEAVKAGEVDILIGTQLLAKGLDLPKLSTLGIVLADSSLYLPDFSARERTYQLLSQALGRIGRGHVAGTAIIQTYQPDSQLLADAISDNWDDFYQSELTERRQYHFPPFYSLLKLSCRRASYKAAETAAAKLKQQLQAALPELEIDGPTPSFHEKLAGQYQVQLVLRSRRRSPLLAAVRLLPTSGWTYDIDPSNLL